jgi:hypothetical protein
LDPSRVLRILPPPVALALLVAISFLPYVFRLGFYSDDWAFLAVLDAGAQQGFAGLFATLSENPNLHARPVQTVHMMLLHEAFGLEPLGYHLVNSATLVAAAVLMYLASRRLELSAGAAFAAALIFVLSPSYTTNRFWFAAFGYVLMMAFYFLSLYADLRALPGDRGKVQWGWKAVALGALALCALGYEVAIPLLIGNLALLAAVARRRGREHGNGLRRSTAVAFFGSNVLVLVGILAFKVATAVGAGLFGGPLEHAARLARSAGLVQFGSYGLALPSTTSWAFGEADAGMVVAAAVVGLSAWAYLELLFRRPGTCAGVGTLRLLVWSLLALVLGYAIFLTTGRFSGASTGINNRINIGGAFGVGLLVVAALGLAARPTGWASARRALSSSAIGLLSFCFVLTVGAVSTYWIDAYRDQQAIVARIEDALPTVPPGATIILAGQCPYRGPAIVFESSWDLSGALALRSGGEPVAANVVTPRLEVERSGLTATIYDEDDGRYPFGRELYLYDDREGSIHVLRNLSSVKEALGEPGVELGTECAPAAEGWGEPVLPLERLLVNRGLTGPDALR